MNPIEKRTWGSLLSDPIPGRGVKPRDTGWTVISDHGLSINEAKDLCDMAGEYIERVKFPFATTVVLKERIVREKLSIYTSNSMEANLGGTCTEIAMYQGVYTRFLDRALDLGFTAIEISDGTIDMSDDARRQAVEMASRKGFKVYTEVGKKDVDKQLPLAEMIRQVKRDVSYDIVGVTIESRGSASGIGVYEKDGSVKVDDVDAIVSAVDPRKLIWEAPTKSGQEFFITYLGNNVNLANVRPAEVISCECLRRGLRSDTLRTVSIPAVETLS